MLSASEGYDLLRDYGVPVPAFEHVITPGAAGAAAERIGFHRISSFEELDFTFQVMGRVLWQRFR